MFRECTVCDVALRQNLLSPQGFLLYQKTTRNSYLESEDGPGRPASNMDRFERCLSIFKLMDLEPQGTEEDPTCAAPQKRWRAVRVDLVVSPISQFAFALLGWTGSKVTRRPLRSRLMMNGALTVVSSTAVRERAAAVGGTREGHDPEQPRSARQHTGTQLTRNNRLMKPGQGSTQTRSLSFRGDTCELHLRRRYLLISAWSTSLRQRGTPEEGEDL